MEPNGVEDIHGERFPFFSDEITDLQHVAQQYIRQITVMDKEHTREVRAVFDNVITRILEQCTSILGGDY